MSGKRYTEEFEVAAVKQVVERWHPAAEVAEPLGEHAAHVCNPTMLLVDGRRYWGCDLRDPVHSRFRRHRHGSRIGTGSDGTAQVSSDAGVDACSFLCRCANRSDPGDTDDQPAYRPLDRVSNGDQFKQHQDGHPVWVVLPRKP